MDNSANLDQGLLVFILIFEKGIDWNPSKNYGIKLTISCETIDQWLLTSSALCITSGHLIVCRQLIELYFKEQ